MSMLSRRKGASAEREVAQIYRDRDFDTARTPNSGGLPRFGQGDVVGVPGVHVEVKRAAALRLWEALEQAATEAPGTLTPALHFRRDTRPGTRPRMSDGWWVALPLSDFIDLLKEAQGV